MKMKTLAFKSALLALAFLFGGTVVQAQEYVRLMETPFHNFHHIQQEFDAYWSNRTYQKGLGYKQYKRWESFIAPRTYPSGEMPDPTILWREMQAFQQGQLAKTRKTAQASWKQIMPHDTLSFTPFSTIPGHGRVSCMEPHPNDTNTIFVGTPSGGLWKTTNGGKHWQPLTDDLPVIGVSDILINPKNPQIMYMATGDNNFINTYSIGVMKSIDGGNSWNTTGLSYNVNQLINIRRLLMHPLHPDTIWAATMNGLFRSNDGGQNWTNVLSGAMRDIEFKPGNLDVLYVTTNGGFYRSTDGGTNFNPVGLMENNAIIRMELATSPADTNVIYVIAVDASNSGLYAFYKSTDGGDNFSNTANTTNILGYSLTGGPGGQAWFDLDIAVDPNDANTVFTAGINIWKSTDGGDSFTPTSDWSDPYASTYVHGDVHKLEFDHGRLFTTCDGGIFKSYDMGTSWTDLSSDLSIHQIYAFEQSPFRDDVILAGMQDVGSSIYNGSEWVTVTWGDGFDAFFHKGDSLKMFTTAHQGTVFKTSTGINGFFSISNMLGETSSFTTVLAQDPHDPSTLYRGLQNVWMSTNEMGSWTPISNFGNSFPLQRIRPSHSKPGVIYATSNFLAYRTLDTGAAWQNITLGLPTNLASISNFHVDPNDHLKIWVTFSGYVNGQKIYFSKDGGNSWTNVSGNLPNLPVNTVISEESKANGVYVGMDAGVFYTNDTLTGWLAFMDGLPNVRISDLTLMPSTLKLRAATFGRGVWESPLYANELALGVQEHQSSEPAEFSLYPNPTKNVLSLELKDESAYRFEIHNSAGQKITAGEISETKTRISTHSLPSGHYMVSVYSDRGVLRKSFFKIP